MYDFDLLESRVKDALSVCDAGHDWYHVERVVINANAIARSEQADMDLVRAMALTHDVADHKFVSENREELFLRVIESVVPADSVEYILDTWRNISYSKGRIPNTIEGKIVQDADRLDAMGAIGVLRTASYSGHSGRVLLNPMNLEDESTTTGHFYEKLLKLKDGMNTSSGRALAEQRHEFMLQFLEQIKAEISRN